MPILLYFRKFTHPVRTTLIDPFRFIGITYKTWITPVKGTNLHNIRSGIGGFADRLGAFAFALTPLTIALCTRDSILSLVTGIPYQSFNFLHRWTGRIILVQSFVHAIIWTIVEGRFYQPQPTTYLTWIKQEYMIWGIVAQAFITFLFVFSLRPVIRWTGYEFFRKSHLLVAGLYLGACYGHWRQLRCWMLASLAIMGLDLVARTVRTLLLHCGYKDARSGFGFRSVPAMLETFKDPSGTIVRMTFEVRHSGWNIGQHFYLTFPALNVWQAHPFTPLSSPDRDAGVQRHTYIIRACAGETRRLAKLAEDAAGRYPISAATTPVVLQGAYGGSIADRGVENVLAVTGGTGITYAIPVILDALRGESAASNIELVWTVRHVDNLAWVEPELAYLKEQLGRASQRMGKRFRMRIFVTRPDTGRQGHVVEHFDKKEYAGDESPSEVTELEMDFEELVRECPGFSITYLNNGRPDVSNLVTSFMEHTVERGRTQVVGSGPPELGSQLRAAVASHNAPGEVWRGNARGDVECVWDDRMG